MTLYNLTFYGLVFEHSCFSAYLDLFLLSLLWFEAAPTSGEFQEVEGETEERRRARLERHHRTKERAVCIIALLYLFP